MILKNLKLSDEPLVERYNQNILGTDFWGYLTKRIQTIKEVSGDDPECASGALAHVDQDAEPNTALVCPQFFDKAYSEYERATVLLHEARHTEGFPHVMCMAGSKVGRSGGCDERIEDRGAYAVNTEATAKTVLRGLNVSEAERKKLRTHLLTYLDSFNEPVGKIGNEAIYLVSQDGKKAYFFDGVSLRPTRLISDTRLVSRSLSLIAVPLDKNDGYGVDAFNKNLSPSVTEGDCILSYNKLPVKDRRPLIEIVVDRQYSACIYENSIMGKITPEGGEDSRVQLPAAIQSIYTGDELGGNTPDSFFVKTTDQVFYRVRFTPENTFEVSSAPDTSERFAKLFFFNNDLTGLSDDGFLMLKNFDTETWNVYPGLEGLRFKSTTRPFLWSQDLVDKL